MSRGIPVYPQMPERRVDDRTDEERIHDVLVEIRDSLKQKNDERFKDHNALWRKESPGYLAIPATGLQGDLSMRPEKGCSMSVRNIVANGFSAGSVIVTRVNGVLVANFTATPATTTSNTGSAASPAGGATITQLPLGVGTYTVTWNVELAGTLAAGDSNNFQLFQSGTGSNVVVENSINPAVAGNYAQESVTIVSTNANNFIKILAIGAGTAGSTYSGQVTITPVPSASGLVANGGSVFFGKRQIWLEGNDQLVVTSVGVTGAPQIYFDSDEMKNWYVDTYIG